MTAWIYGAMLLAALATISGGIYKIHDAGYEQAKAECAEASRQRELEERARADKAATNLEKDNAKAKVVYRTITKQVDKYIDRPVYRNICLDADGLRDANAALSGALTPAGEPDKRVPRPNTP